MLAPSTVARRRFPDCTTSASAGSLIDRGRHEPKPTRRRRTDRRQRRDVLRDPVVAQLGRCPNPRVTAARRWQVRAEGAAQRPRERLVLEELVLAAEDRRDG